MAASMRKASGIKRVMPGWKRRALRFYGFWNNDVLKNTEGVLELIFIALKERPSPGALRAPPSPRRERGTIAARSKLCIRRRDVHHPLRSARSSSPIHPEGYPFVGGFALVTLILFWLWPPLGWLGDRRDAVVRLFLPRSAAGHAGARWPSGVAGGRHRQPGGACRAAAGTRARRRVPCSASPFS